MEPITRILGIDHGDRRIGAALSDAGQTMAFPLEVYSPRGEAADARHYRELADENDVSRIVVGLPVHTTGREGERARAARAFGAWLTRVTQRPVVFFDECYTTIEVEHLTWRTTGTWEDHRDMQPLAAPRRFATGSGPRTGRRFLGIGSDAQGSSSRS